MPLSILLPMVVLGIAGIAVLLHVLGLSHRAILADESAASRAWLREFPGHRPTRVILCQNRLAALVKTEQGYGVVWPMGADTTARYLTQAHITADAKGLRINLPDFTASRIGLSLDPDEAARWLETLKEPA